MTTLLILASSLLQISMTTPACQIDLNQDGMVGFLDLSILLSQSHSQEEACSDCSADFDGDGDVDFADQLTLLNAWGSVCGDIEVCDGSNGSITLDEVRNDLEASYIQTCDINAASLSSFEPIGSESPFSGVYNGGDYKISNLNLSTNEAVPVGLFGKIAAGTVKNLQLENITSTGTIRVGSLAGEAASSELLNISVRNSNVSGVDQTGGLIGHGRDVYVEGIHLENISVTGVNETGGALGYVSSQSLISDINASAIHVEGDNLYTGGLVGYLYSSTIKNVSPETSVEVKAGCEYSGGIVGWASSSQVLDASATVLITDPPNDCASGHVGSYIGGAIGGMLEGGLASNLSLSVDITATNDSLYIGGLVGMMEGTYYEDGTAEIINSSVTGSVAKGQYSSGFVGETRRNSRITFSNFQGQVSNSHLAYTGGFLGKQNGNNVYIADSFVVGEITTGSSAFPGGFISQTGFGLSNSVVERCFFEGTINSYSPVGAGAFIGNLVSGTVRNSYALGNINAESGIQAGGFVGNILFGRIEDSFSHVNIHMQEEHPSESHQSRIGGFVGKYGQAFASPQIFRSYQDGQLSAGDPSIEIGGFIGRAASAANDSFLESNYWNTSSSVQNPCAGSQNDTNLCESFDNFSGVAGLTEAQMHQQQSFSGFDFESIWSIEESSTSPYLQWMSSPPTP
jgi:hypothetical protein